MGGRGRRDAAIRSPPGWRGRKRIFWEYDTRGSRVITDLSTNVACGCLTSQIGRDVVLSAKCGRTQRCARGRLVGHGGQAGGGAAQAGSQRLSKKKLAPFGAISKD